jgi:hypothetical protein
VLLLSGSAVTSGTFRDSVGVTQNVTSNTSGPVGTFNQSGNGAAGGNRNKLSVEITVNGWIYMERASYAGNISGGAGGALQEWRSMELHGNKDSGSGGGGGAEQVGATTGGVGGSGEINYRFLRVN